MIRRKGTSQPEPPSERVTYEIPDSHAHLPTLSRSPTHAALQQTQYPIHTQTQTLETPIYPGVYGQEIRWKTRQRNFPNGQSWVQSVTSNGARAYGLSLEAKLKEKAREAVYPSPQPPVNPGVQTNDTFSPSSVPNTSHDVHHTTQTTANASAPSSQQLWTRDEQLVMGKKRKRVEFVAKHQRDFPQTQPWPSTYKRAAAMTLKKDIQERRQATVMQLLQSDPVSISASETNVQVPTNPPAAAPIVDSQSEPEPDSQPETQPEASTNHSHVLDLSGDPDSISALIARKRAQNAASGQLLRLLNMQEEHRQKEGVNESPKPVSPYVQSHPPSVPPAFPTSAWRSSPTPTPSQPASQSAASRPPQRKGYAELPLTDRESGDEASELDLRSLFTNPGPSFHPNGSEDDDTSRVLRQAIQGYNNHDPSASKQPQRPSNPPSFRQDSKIVPPSSSQLLENSNFATAGLSSQHTHNENRSPYPPLPSQSVPPGSMTKVPHLANTSRQRPPQSQPSHHPQPPQMRTPFFPYNGSPSVPYQQTYTHPVSPIYFTPHQPTRPTISLTPEQQEMKLIQQQTERSQQERKVKELRMKAEEMARAVQEEHKRGDQKTPQTSDKSAEASGVPRPSSSSAAGKSKSSSSQASDLHATAPKPAKRIKTATTSANPQGANGVQRVPSSAAARSDTKNPTSRVARNQSNTHSNQTQASFSSVSFPMNRAPSLGPMNSYTNQLFRTTGPGNPGMSSRSIFVGAGMVTNSGVGPNMMGAPRFRNAGVDGFEVPKR